MQALCEVLWAQWWQIALIPAHKQFALLGPAAERVSPWLHFGITSGVWGTNRCLSPAPTWREALVWDGAQSTAVLKCFSGESSAPRTEHPWPKAFLPARLSRTSRSLL